MKTGHLLFTGLLCIFLPQACQKNGIDTSRPWVVILDEAPTRSSADKLGKEYADSQPDKLKGTCRLSTSELGLVHHLIVSPGFEKREGAQALASELGKGGQIRLRVLDIRKVSIAKEGEEADGVPDELDALEELAALVPAQPDMEPESFLLMLGAQQACESPVSFGRSVPREWSTGFCRLGLADTADAAFRFSGSPEDRRVLVFVGRTERPEPSDGDLLVNAYHFLAAHMAPSEEEWERIKEKKKTKRKRRGKRSRRARGKKMEEPELVAPLTLPAMAEPVERQLPWGKTPVHILERVTLLPTAKYREDLPLWTAWLGWLPQRRGVFIILYMEEKDALTLSVPSSLGRPKGLSTSPAFLGAWGLLPEMGIADEEFSFLGSIPFSGMLKGRVRKADWARRYAGRRVIKAGYRTPDTSWAVSWVDLESEAEAESVFESGFVAPRQQLIQKVLKSKRQVRYEVGVNLIEVGDVNGWFLKGARGGHTKEMYFRHKTRVWLLETPQRAKNALGVDDLNARAELLQIWDMGPQ